MSLLIRSPNLYYGNGRRRHVKRRKHGMGFFKNLGAAISKAHDWIKSNHIISNVGNALSGVPGIGGIAGTIGNVAGSLGYGRKKVYRRRVRHVLVRRKAPVKRRVVLINQRRRRIGHGFFSNLGSALSKANNFAKSSGIVSKGLTALGHPNAASFASNLGYGKRRTVRKRRVVRRPRRIGHGFFSKIGSVLSKANNYAKTSRIVSKGLTALGHPNAAGFASSLGYGKIRKVIPVRRGLIICRAPDKRRRVVHRPKVTHKGRRHHGGGGTFFSLSQVAAPKF